MVKKKPSLKKVLKRIDKMPDNMFGDVEVDLSTLPCLMKPKKEKITANFDADLLKKIKDVADVYDVSYTVLMNDVLRKVFIEKKKAS